MIVPTAKDVVYGPRMIRARKPRGVRLYLALALVPLLCVFPYLGTVNNPNENVRSYMTMALVEQHQLRIDDYITAYGWVNDMARVPSADGAHYYSVKAPGTSLLGVPAYWVLLNLAPLFHVSGAHVDGPATRAQRISWLRTTTWTLRLFAVQLPCALFLIWLERYLRGITRDDVLRLAAVTAACLGTNYLAYTNIYASHALCGAAAFVAFGLTERALRVSSGRPLVRRKRVAFCVGLALGMSVLLEYHVLPMAFVIGIYALTAFWRPRTLVPLVLGGLIDVAAMMLFQWRAYGNPLTPGHKMVANAEFAAQHAQGLFGITLPSKEALAALSFDLGFGFFGTSPYMWLGLLVIPFGLFVTHGRSSERRRRRAAVAACVVAMVALWGVSAGFLHWRGGWTVGPRYLAPAPPFFAFGALVALEAIAARRAWARTIVRGVSVGLATASVMTIGIVGIVYDTLPESFTRPLVQFVVPLVYAGFVPHHVAEWFGWDSTTFWYLVAACLVAAAVLPLFLRASDSVRARAARVVIALATFACAMIPAFSKPDAPPPDTGGFMGEWEPSGRDRITLMRNDAERYGPRRPCAWYRLADLERAVGLEAQALRDESRGLGAPRDQCPRRILAP